MTINTYNRVYNDDSLEPLVITGMAFEFPNDATTDDSFWEMLSRGRSAHTEFPSDRMNVDSFYHPDKDRPSSIHLRGGHFVSEDIAAFDAPFFSINASEASCMDPQHRRMLEVSYHAIEDAGIPISELSGSDTSVYTGCFTNDYLSILQQDPQAEQRHAAMGIAPSMLANRVSWFFNLKGTSMNLDSACSSSLLALHLACQDLRVGTSSMALVGGANLVYHPNFMKFMSDFNFLSPDSRCWSFDERANGYARGEGISVMVIKRLTDALKHGDTIRAVIRNTGSNQDGRTPGITQPNGLSQHSLIEETYRRASLDMGPTQYFEAHGTGTPVGDPIEANAIGAAFAKNHPSHTPLYIGAVKANIGHLEGCSGLAGLVKTVLILERGLIPPIAGLGSLNKKINPELLNLHFPTKPIPWPSCSIRRACVNSFGFGGTNAVAILDDTYHFLQQRGLIGFHRTLPSPSENYSHLPAILPSPIPLHSESTQEAQPRLLVWSSPDQGGTQRFTALYQQYLAKQPNVSLDDLAYTLSARRSQYSWRSFCNAVYEEKSGAHKPTQQYELSLTCSLPSAPTKAQGNVRLAFVFTGQGAQYLEMGRSLSHFSSFLESVKTSESVLKTLGCTWSLEGILKESDDMSNHLDMAEISQPVTTCFQIALVDLLASYNVSPAIVLGHSSGEIAAAYAAKALSKTSAVKAAYLRGQLCAKAAVSDSGTKLGMMAVALSAVEVESYFQHLQLAVEQLQVAIGCINSPKSITLTGDLAQLSIIEGFLKEDGVFARILRVPVAYHSAYMTVVAQEYHDALGVLESSVSDTPIPMVSSVTGDVIAPQDLLQPAYWVKNLVSPVKFADAMTTLVALANSKPRKQLGKKVVQFQATHIVEIGPHKALAGPIQESMSVVAEDMRLTYIPSLVRGVSPRTAVLNMFGSLFCAGYPIDLLRVNGLDHASSRKAPADMPCYPFNHQNKYWLEGRLSTNFRFGKAARHELIGARSLDWNPKMAQWRNVMRLQELPWLADHTIAGQIVFPGAGYVVIAVEGYKQLLGSSAEMSTSLLGVHLRDIAFTRPIRFPPNTDQIETQVTISSLPQSQKELESWLQFRIFVLDNGEYFECCSAYIRGVFNKTDRQQVASSGPWKSPSWYEDISSVCNDRPLRFYDALHSSSKLQYGPSFQCLQDVCLGAGGEAISGIDTLSWCRETGEKSLSTYLIHPSTLDGLAQLTVPSLAKLMGSKGPSTMVPTKLADLWLDNIPEALSSGVLKIHSATTLRGHRGALANIVGAADGIDRPVITLRGLETTFIEQNMNTVVPSNDTARELCTRLSWKPDVTLMSTAQIVDHCVLHRPDAPESEVSVYQDMLTAIMAFVEEAIAYLESTDLHLSPHLSLFTKWMVYQSQLLHSGSLPVLPEMVYRLLSMDDGHRNDFVEKVKKSGCDGALFMTIGRNLLDVLRGDSDPLQLIFHEGLANRYYEQMLSNPHHSHPASEYLELLSFQNPAMRILEVGAGTGGQTLRSLEALSTNGVKKWDRYDYTDISPSFFEQARVKFQDHESKMNFRVCNISKSPSQQSFDEGSYDLVIASHVLHATDCLHESLSNIRRLLKPGGKLLLFEITVPEAIAAFAFGLLKGWWSPLDNETRSDYSPCITAADWDKSLRGAGFSGVDFDIPGQQNVEVRFSSIMVSTAMELPSTRAHRFSTITVKDDSKPNIDLIGAASLQKGSDLSSTASTMRTSSASSNAAGSNKDYTELSSDVDSEIHHQIILLVDPLSPIHNDLSKELAASLEASGRSCCIETLSTFLENSTSDTRLVVSLLEVDAFFLYGISASAYCQLQKLLVRYKSCLWVYRSACSTEGTADPRHGLADGLGRVLMSEDPTLQFTTVSLDNSSKDSKLLMALISSLVNQVITNVIEDVETKYIIRNGVPWIGRVQSDRKMDSMVSERQLPVYKQLLPFNSEGKRVYLDFTSLSAAPLQWNASSIRSDKENFGFVAGEVSVRVNAIGLTTNADDCPSGIEYAGEVVWAADASTFKRGHRVCFLSPPSTTLSSVVRVPETSLVIIPSSISYTDAVSICSPAWIAYQALFNVIRVQAGDQILLHRIHTSILQIIFQFAKHLGITVYITAVDEVDQQAICTQYQVSSERVFVADQSLPDKIRSATHNSGADAIIGQLSVDDFKSWDISACLSSFGRAVEIGNVSRTSKRLNIHGAGFATNISYVAIDMQDALLRNPPMAYSIFENAITKTFSLGLSLPLPANIVSVDNIKDMLAVGHDHKTIVSIEPDALVSANISQSERYRFSSSATYVIAGGLGGLGRILARWMASRGAKHLILLSRSGAAKGAAKELVEDLQLQNVWVETPCVDIGDLDALKLTIQNLRSSGMPDIRGCIQASVVLRDNFFENMSYEDWTFSTNAKVVGSWNLHIALPDGLDFFILLSSLNGIVGGRGQANYSAGNTFKDALAEYRLSIGEKAISLDLGLMVSEGVVAENPHLLASLRRVGHLMDIENEEFLSIVDYYCDPNLPILKPEDSQTLIGLEMPHAVQAKGIDLNHAIYRPMFRELFQNIPRLADSSTVEANASATISRKSRLAAVKTFEGAKALITGWLCDKLSQILGLDDKDLDTDRAIHTFGIDSLVAIDLKNWLSRDIGAQLEVFTLLSNITVSQLADEITAKCTFGQ